MIALGWIIFAAVVFLVVCLNFFIVRYYRNKDKAELITNVVAIISLSAVLLTVLLIPVDIFSTTDSHHVKDAEPIVKSLQIFYYTFYATVMLCMFLLVPFAWFWYEAEDPEEESTPKRCYEAWKFTIGFVICVVVLFLIGLLVKWNKPTFDKHHIAKWMADLVDAQNRGENAITFVIAIMALLGCLVWMSYTAYGLSALPIGMIKGKRGRKEEIRKYEEQKYAARSKRERIQNKERLKRGDEAQVSLLKDQERVASRRLERVDKATSGWRRIFVIWRPFEVILGIVFMLLSLAIVVAIFLTNLDKILNSHCGVKCGFILQYGPKIFNPLDKLLVILAKYFPVDYIVIAAIALYVYMCTLSGVSRIGIRLLWFKLYSFRPGGTPPQGLLSTAWLLMLSTVALNNQLISIAPQYVQFGSQTFMQNGTHSMPCDGDHVTNSTCRWTIVGQVTNRVNLSMPWFGFLFYWATWGFIGCWLIGFFIAVFCARKSNIEEYSDDEYEQEEAGWN